MDLEKAVKAMIETRKSLRSREGITNPHFISENMQRLTQFTGAVEEHLAQFEEELETAEAVRFRDYLKQGMSVNMADKLAKEDVAEKKGQIAKLVRYVNSSWKITEKAQSRWNHLDAEYKQGKHST